MLTIARAIVRTKTFRKNNYFMSYFSFVYDRIEFRLCLYEEIITSCSRDVNNNLFEIKKLLCMFHKGFNLKASL